jgi:hypothetical protein
MAIKMGQLTKSYMLQGEGQEKRDACAAAIVGMSD